MAYNLPPPWDPGFALPENVKDEGLERRAFVTRQAPRGTYDNPKVGTAGYSVPAYVLKEGYGQGAMVTKMAPRGRYDIPVPNYLNARSQVLSEQRLPGGGTKVTMAALGSTAGSALPANYTRFGQQAASVIMSRVLQLPESTRKPALKKILDTIDGTLWSKTAALAEKLAKTGMNPTAAVTAALARSMSEGAAREVVQAGRTGKNPPARSIMGLGCYGASFCVAMGDTASSVAGRVFAALGLGEDAPVRAGYCWTIGASGTGYWRRQMVGETCTTAPPAGATTPTVRDQRATATAPVTGGGIVVTNTATGEVVKTVVSAPPETAQVQMISVGPWLFRADASTRIHWTSKLPADWQAEMKRVIQEKGNTPSSSRQLGVFFDSPPALFNTKFIGLVGAQGSGMDKPGWSPVARAKHPINGKDYGIFVGIGYKDGSKPTSDPSNTPIMHIKWQEIDKAWYADVWDFIKEVAAKIVDVAGDVLDKVSDLACGLANAPSSDQAGAAIGVASGAGAATGQAGAAIIKAACHKDPAPDADAGGGGVAPSSNILPLAIAGAAAVGLAYYFTRKK